MHPDRRRDLRRSGRDLRSAGLAERYERTLRFACIVEPADPPEHQLAERRRLHRRIEWLRRGGRAHIATLVALPVTESDIQALYVQHGYFLFRRCLTFMADEASAQDAVQEIFVRALQSASTFRGAFRCFPERRKTRTEVTEFTEGLTP